MAVENISEIMHGFLNMEQPAVGPRVNMDTILLAGFSRIKKNEKVLELGCAHGAVSLIMAKRTPQASFRGIDIQLSLIEMARRNAELNGLVQNTAFDVCDLRKIKNTFLHQSLDVVTVNPPYEDPGCGRKSHIETNRIARQGEFCTFEDVCRASHFVLKSGGRLYMVMRALRMAETFETLRRHHLEPRTLRTVHSTQKHNAAIFLLEARRDGGAALTVQPPLIVYDGAHEYTGELKKFYEPEI